MIKDSQIGRLTEFRLGQLECLYFSSVLLAKSMYVGLPLALNFFIHSLVFSPIEIQAASDCKSISSSSKLSVVTLDKFIAHANSYAFSFSFSEKSSEVQQFL